MAQPHYTIDTFAGIVEPPSGPASEAFLDTPSGIAQDSSGNIYIADPAFDWVIRVAPSGEASLFAGTGQLGFSGDGGPATLAQMWSPEDVAVGPDGSVYIADRANSRIRRVAPDGAISTFAGGGAGGPGGPANEASTSVVESVAVDPVSGDVYFGSSAVRTIWRVGADGILTVFAGGNGQGFSGDGGPAVDAQFRSVRHITVGVDSSVYFTDEGNNRVRKIDPQGVITTVAGNGDRVFSGDADTDGQPATQIPLGRPNGIFGAPDGSVLLAEESTRVIRRLLPDGTNQLLAGVESSRGGTGVFLEDGLSPAETRFSSLQDVIQLQSGEVCVTGRTIPRLRCFPGDATGVVSARAGSDNVKGDGGPALRGRLYDPRGVAVDSAGNVYIAETGNQVIRKVSVDGTIARIAGLAGRGEPTTPLQGVAALGAPVGQVESVAVDQAGNVYADGLVSVQKVTAAGTLNVTSLVDPDGMRIFVNNVYADAQGVVYLTETASNRVMKLENGNLTTIAGNGTRGFAGDGGPALDAQLSAPEGLTGDGEGNIYFADNGNRRIRKVDSNGIITTVAGGGNGAVFNGVPATSVGFSEPSDVAVGPDGALYISERTRDVIFRVENTPAAALSESGKSQGIVAGATINIVAGTLNANAFSGDGGPATQAGLDSPQGIAFGPGGRLYIADSNNHRIRVLTMEEGGARISDGGIVNAATFGAGSAAAEAIYTLFGENLATTSEAATSTPLPTTLAGATVEVADAAGTVRLAPLFFAGPSQINFLIPAGTGEGEATVTVRTGDGGSSNPAPLEITAVAPGLFSANANGSGVGAIGALRIAPDGTRTSLDVIRFDAAAGAVVSVPIDLSVPGDVFLLLFGTGLRGFSSTAVATIGGQNVPVVGLAAQGVFVGLDQANVGPIPASLMGNGSAEIRLTVDGVETNTVLVGFR